MAKPLIDDWQTGRSLGECNKYILMNKIDCDVTFVVGKDQKENIPAHKGCLARRSSVFSTMFYGSLPESDTIAIPDIEPDVFRELLSYIYTDELELTMNNVFSVLDAANKYSMRKLMIKCSTFLQENICVKNVCETLEYGHMYDLQELFEKCKQFILKNSSEMLTSTELMQIRSSCLKSIISSDDFGEDEFDIFNAVTNWAENQCKKKNMTVTAANKRQVLDDLLYEIRFPLMNVETFARIAETAILTDDEQLQVFKVISKGTQNSTKFSSKPRSSSERSFYHPDLKEILDRDSSYDKTTTDTDTIKISPSRDVSLRGFIVHHRGEFDGIIDISLQENSRMPAELLSVVVLKWDGKKQFLRGGVIKPIDMHARGIYTFKVNICPRSAAEYTHKLVFCKALFSEFTKSDSITEIPRDHRTSFTLTTESIMKKFCKRKIPDKPMWMVGIIFK